ncbi:Amidase domain-containing protein [Psidium guajava]|nr:Amidase domain-containing protein [Psidium guajava]
MYIAFHKGNIFPAKKHGHTLYQPVPARQKISPKRLNNTFFGTVVKLELSYTSSTSLMSLVVVHHQQNKISNPDMTNHQSIASRSP